MRMTGGKYSHAGIDESNHDFKEFLDQKYSTKILGTKLSTKILGSKFSIQFSIIQAVGLLWKDREIGLCYIFHEHLEQGNHSFA